MSDMTTAGQAVAGTHDTDHDPGLRTRWQALQDAERAAVEAARQSSRTRRELKAARQEFDRYLASAFDDSRPLYAAAGTGDPEPSPAPPRPPGANGATPRDGPAAQGRRPCAAA